MTIILGIVCNDGVVLAADSEVTFERGVPVKRLNVDKIFRLGQNFAIGGAGSAPFVQECLDGITREFDRLVEQGEPTFFSLRQIAGEVVAGIYGKHLQRMRLIGYTSPINVTMILAGVEKINGDSNKHLYVLYNTGLLEREENYAMIGSAAAYAELLLGGYTRYYKDKLSLQQGTVLAYNIVKEIETVDFNVGGPVKIANLTKDGFKVLAEDGLPNRANPEKEDRRKQLIADLDLKSMFGIINNDDLYNALNKGAQTDHEDLSTSRPSIDRKKESA